MRNSAIVHALGESFIGKLDGICDTFMQISAGQPPHDKDMKKVSELTKEALQRAALFCKYEFTAEELKHRGKQSANVLYGTQALQYRYRMLEDQHKKGSGSPVDMLAHRPVKQFKWLLEDEQKLQFSKWLRLAVPMHLSSAPAITAGESDKKDEAAIVLASVGASSSGGASSSSGQSAAAKQKLKAQALAQESKKAMLAKFFKK